MARLRKFDPLDDVEGEFTVPDELRDFQHPVWRSRAATMAWYLEHVGFVPKRVEHDRLWQGRRAHAELDWAMGQGLVNPKFPKLPDLPRIQALGISQFPALERREIQRALMTGETH